MVALLSGLWAALPLLGLDVPTPRPDFAEAPTVGLFAAGLVVSRGDVQEGIGLAGAGLLALAGWLAAHDVTRRAFRQAGLTHYMAACLLAGDAWLATAGAVAALRHAGRWSGVRRDAERATS